MVIKKTQLRELLADIRTSRVSYIAVLLFVTLGVLLFTGLGWSAHLLELTLDEEYRVTRYHDYEIVSPAGLSDEDIARITACDPSLSAEPMYSVTQYFSWGDNREQASVLSITEHIDPPELKEGRLPTSPGEIAVEGSGRRNTACAPAIY